MKIKELAMFMLSNIDDQTATDIVMCLESISNAREQIKERAFNIYMEHIDPILTELESRVPPYEYYPVLVKLYKTNDFLVALTLFYGVIESRGFSVDIKNKNLLDQLTGYLERDYVNIHIFKSLFLLDGEIDCDAIYDIKHRKIQNAFEAAIEIIISSIDSDPYKEKIKKQQKHPFNVIIGTILLYICKNLDVNKLYKRYKDNINKDNVLSSTLIYMFYCYYEFYLFLHEGYKIIKEEAKDGTSLFELV